ncbi:uncharacterized protein LOC129744638 [Uranotaenia lowii]|uniref:uncharacterized protein LOC129744638 n=1 Tax=Uranotaenia lowii TaxID=190385 RepID=UPI00247AD869|nr:uncharacterized protein LOC129744638 [Uranotaenia lowii]
MKRSIKEFAASIDPQISSKALWDKINRIAGNNKKQKTNNPIQEDVDMAEKFMDLHFGNNDIDFDIPLSYGRTCEYNILNAELWNSILCRKKNRSAPSNDQITYGNLSYQLKEIKVIAIPKHGKDQSSIEGKRPISLVPTLTKILNSAVLEKIQTHININNILPEKSFGFRKNVSTTTCINFLTNIVKDSKRKKLITSIIFIDLMNAFNAVKTELLEDIMTNQRFPPEIVVWVGYFLRNRKLSMQVGQSCVTRTISNGLPQGDVLSPTLFNLYTSDLHLTQNEDADILQFADDFALVVRGKSLETVEQRTQELLNNFVSRARRLNFQINPAKTKALLLLRGKRKHNIRIHNVPVETVASHKYLGIHIDRSFGFGIHAKQTAKQIQERLRMMKVICGTREGSHPQTMSLVFNALLRSKAEYGSSIIGNTCKTNKEKIQVILNDAMRKATGCSRTTPRNTLLAIAGQEPWEVRNKFVTCKETARTVYYRTPVYNQLQKVSDFRGDTKKLSFMEKIFVEYQETFMRISPMVQSKKIEVNISTNIGINCSKNNVNPRVLKQKVLGILNSRYNHCHRIYTDASKLGDRCGIGVYIESRKRKIILALDRETSIMTAELLAINTATEEIRKERFENSVILTDSLSSCTLLGNYLDQINRCKIVDAILKSCEELNIQIQWIPSHIDLSGNDIADELAKKGTGTNDIESIRNPILLKDAYLYFEKHKQNQANNWYTMYSQELSKGLKFFNIQPQFSAKPWYHKMDLTNTETRTLNRLMAGHDYSKYWLNKMRIVDNPNC